MSKTPRMDAWRDAYARNPAGTVSLYERGCELELELRKRERELVDARNVQHHIVTMPDGSAVAAPCAISGCQYARPPESATPAAVVIVDAVGNPSVVLDSKFRASLTTGEHVLFARRPEGVELSKERKLLAETAMWLSEIINTAGDTWDDERDLELLPRIGEIAFKQAEKIRAYMNSLPSQEQK